MLPFALTVPVETVFVPSFTVKANSPATMGRPFRLLEASGVHVPVFSYLLVNFS